ncbi:MAG: DUF4280 domain-containing protein [Acetatifactor sp.]|nr:DUF4280 domain-containing protein [Acetatifactor sp.]
MAGEGKDYVVYSMKAKCSEGTMENFLTTDTGHGVTYQGNPLMNANDHIKQVNLTHFGDCNAKQIYEQAKAQADEKYKADADDGLFALAGKFIAKTVTKNMINFQEHFMFHKCELDTPLPWVFCNDDHEIEGAPALTLESQCPCRYGGIISIVPVEEEPGEVDTEEKNVELEQVDNVVNQYENELIEKYGDAIETYLAGNEDDPAYQDALDILKGVNMMEILQKMGDEINGLPAIQNNKNEFPMFINLVNSSQPLDLKNRKQISQLSGQEYSIWSLPWGDGNGGTITQGDYMGNWLYGYVGSEYFTIPGDELLLKFGAGGAQLLSDLKGKKVDQSYKEIVLKYIKSMLSGNYGDNINDSEDEKSDSEMIQDGIDAYKEAEKKK